MCVSAPYTCTHEVSWLLKYPPQRTASMLDTDACVPLVYTLNPQSKRAQAEQRQQTSHYIVITVKHKSKQSAAVFQVTHPKASVMMHCPSVCHSVTLLFAQLCKNYYVAFLL